MSNLIAFFHNLIFSSSPWILPGGYGIPLHVAKSRPGSISLSGNLHLSYGFLTSPLSAVRRKCKVRTLLKKAANPQRRKYHEKFIQVSDWEQQYYNHRWHHHSFEQNKIISPGVDMVRQNGWYRCSCVTKRKISYLLCHNSRS